MHRRLAELVEYLDATRASLLDVAALVSPDRFAERPAPDRWSAAEVMEHLARVEGSCARVVGKLSAEARRNGVGAESEESSVLQVLDHLPLKDRTKRLEAPELVAPSGGWTRERALEAIAASRTDMMRAVADAEGLALGSVRFTHARLGELDLYQWILFVGKHEERHTAQLQEIVAQLGAATDLIGTPKK
jgi:uncharacterized damage-inducible protein DinB